jgi:aminopeptidase YwaD
LPVIATFVFSKKLPMPRKPLFALPLLLSFFPLMAQTPATPGRMEHHVSVLASDSLLGRGFGTEQGAKAAAYIAGQFREAGLEPLNGSYLHPFNHRLGILNISGTNVVGVIPGSDPALRGEYIVLGAHFDHLGWKIEHGDTVVYNGADDNASGTASIIEIGRSLAAQKDSLGRSVVLVAFDGEESGLIGSTHFLEDQVLPPKQIKLMFSLDMVGMYGAHGGVDLYGIKQLSRADLLTGEIAAAHDLVIKKANGRTAQRTDTAPFGNRGIPSVHTFTGTESPYHKPEDVAEKLDYQGMSLIANYLSDATLELSREETLSSLPGPGEEGTPEKTDIFRAGARINFGSGNHNYKEEFYRGKTIFALEAGLFASLRITPHLSLQPELLYETKGSQHAEGTYRTHAVTVPVNLQFTLAEESMIRSYIQLGGYYSYHLGGKLGNEPIDYTGTYTPHEFGFTYGVGFEVMQVQFGFYSQQGLTSILNGSDETGSAILPQSIYFMLGFVF